ncbi:MAG: hypothetical protein OXF44_14085 [Anaerolineaceae bacterium]|nr:hypothetical protein [Anaerolineaceae bacterium]
MNRETREQLGQIVPALKALEQSLRQAMGADATVGAGALALRSYSSLQACAAESLPDDVFVVEALRLEPEPEPGEEQLVAQVSLACSQLLLYLESLLQARRRPQIEFAVDFGDIGCDLCETIRSLLAQARAALRDLLLALLDGEPQPGRAREAT